MKARCLAVRLGGITSTPVAVLRWKGEKPEVSIFDKAVESILRHYLNHSLAKAPTRIRRKKRDGSEIIDVFAEEVRAPDRDFLRRWATKLTFSVRNTEKFIFTVVDEDEFSQRGKSPELYLESNLFELSSTFKSSCVTCACGCQYPFLTIACPQCCSFDPLGALWEKYASLIVRKFNETTQAQLQSRSVLQESLKSVQASFRSAVNASKSTAFAPLDSDDETAVARKLLAYYQGVFREGCLPHPLIENLKTADRREFSGIITVLRNIALDVRTIWKPACSTGWNPNQHFLTNFQTELLNCGRPAIQTIGRTGQQMIKVAAYFTPFHNEYKKRSVVSEIDAGTVLKGAWRALKAVKTFGLSEAIRFGINEAKDQKFRERFQRFSESFDRGVAACENSDVAIAQSLALHNTLLSGLSKGMSYHLVIVLAEDYAAAKPDERVRIAECLAKAISRQIPKPPQLTTSIPPTKSKPVNVFTIFMWVGVALLFVLSILVAKSLWR